MTEVFHKSLGHDGPAARFLSIEYERLSHGVRPDEVIQGLNVETYLVRTFGDADQMLVRIRQLMILINEYGANASWPSHAEWLKLLPAWVSENAGPNEVVVDPDTRTGLLIKQTTSQEEDSSDFEDQVSVWIDWFSPTQRDWLWWAAQVVDHATILVGIDRLSDHYPIYPGAFVWLLTIAGASSIQASPDMDDSALFPASTEAHNPLK